MIPAASVANHCSHRVQYTITVDNSAEASPQTGWTFLDDLPDDLVVASPANTSTTCPNGAVNAPAGAITVGASGDVAAGATCTLSFDVVSTVAATYSNGATNISAIGVIPPAQPTTLDVVGGDGVPVLSPEVGDGAALLALFAGGLFVLRRRRSLPA